MLTRTCALRVAVKRIEVRGRNGFGAAPWRISPVSRVAESALTTAVTGFTWSTDFPHPVCNWPNAGQKIQEQFAGVPEEEVHAITWSNGARMYVFEQ